MSAPPSVPDVDVSALSLVELRGYRMTLEAEEDRVSYWRRLIHARIDVIEAESESGARLTTDDLVRVLGDTGTGHRRRVLLRIKAAEPLPELPEVVGIWGDVAPGDRAGARAALERLRAAEGQLTAYRTALHARIDEATGHLIDRYRSDPGAALSLIPHE